MQEAAEEQPVAGEQPELDRQERALIANILRLRETTADDVMLPRADIVAMRVDVSLEEALQQIRREGHSRLPVFREQLDDIVGMVHIKDVYRLCRPAGGVPAGGDPAQAADGGTADAGAGPAAADAPGSARIWRLWSTNMAASTGW